MSSSGETNHNVLIMTQIHSQTHCVQMIEIQKQYQPLQNQQRLLQEQDVW